MKNLDAFRWIIKSLDKVVFSLQSIILLPSEGSGREGSVGIVTVLPAERTGLDSRQGRNFHLSHTVSTSSAPPPSSPGGWVCSSGVKRPERESDHSLRRVLSFKNAWSYTSTPPSVGMAWCLGNFGVQLYFHINFTQPVKVFDLTCSQTRHFHITRPL
jgi:hypothetical protein